MNINGKFCKVSSFDEKNILVGFLGDVWPHDLTAAQIDYIKRFYSMPNNAKHEFMQTWPGGIMPSCAAHKSNFKNGFMLIYREGGEE